MHNSSMAWTLPDTIEIDPQGGRSSDSHRSLTRIDQSTSPINRPRWIPSQITLLRREPHRTDHIEGSPAASASASAPPRPIPRPLLLFARRNNLVAAATADPAILRRHRRLPLPLRHVLLDQRRAVFLTALPLTKGGKTRPRRDPCPTCHLLFTQFTTFSELSPYF